jgi:hypothetical protein
MCRHYVKLVIVVKGGVAMVTGTAARFPLVAEVATPRVLTGVHAVLILS